MRFRSRLPRDDGLRTPDLGPQTSDYGPLTSDFSPCPGSDVRGLRSDVLRPGSGVRIPACYNASEELSRLT